MNNIEKFHQIKNASAVSHKELYLLFDNLPTISESDTLE